MTNNKIAPRNGQHHTTTPTTKQQCNQLSCVKQRYTTSFGNHRPRTKSNIPFSKIILFIELFITVYSPLLLPTTNAQTTTTTATTTTTTTTTTTPLPLPPTTSQTKVNLPFVEISFVCKYDFRPFSLRETMQDYLQNLLEGTTDIQFQTARALIKEDDFQCIHGLNQTVAQLRFTGYAEYPIGQEPTEKQLAETIRFSPMQQYFATNICTSINFWVVNVNGNNENFGHLTFEQICHHSTSTEYASGSSSGRKKAGIVLLIIFCVLMCCCLCCVARFCL